MAEPDESYETYETAEPEESSEPDEPRRPKPAAIPPLPRLWKAAPEEELPSPVPTKVKKKKKSADAAQATDEALDDGTGATKLAETPVLDTYEARQRARWIIGGVTGSIALIALFLIVRSFGGKEPEPKEAPEPRENRAAADLRAKSEQEAHSLVEIARQADKAGKLQAALVTLRKVADEYQGTPSARVAMEAIDRNRKKRSLFGTDGEDHPTGPAAPTSPPAVATLPATTTAPTATPAGPIPNIPTALAPTTPKDASGPIRPGVDGPGGTEIATRAKPLPVGFTARPGAPLHASGWPTEIVCNKDGAAMVLVPGSTFHMGREDGEPAESPAHLVKVSTFYIDKHEVTARQFEQFLKETGRPLDALRFAAKSGKNSPNLPAIGVTAREAKSYCEDWGRRRLPTEAQWELAARSPEGKISFWNGEMPRPDSAKEGRPIEPVMSLPSDVSPAGAFDLGANAWEWISDWYDSQYYQQVKNGATDPVGPASSRVKPSQKTVKGGSKAGILTWREGVKIEARLPYLGFRGALPVEGALIAPPAATAPVGVPATPGGVPPM